MPAISTREEEEVRVVRLGWGFLNWKLDNLAAVGLVFFFFWNLLMNRIRNEVHLDRMGKVGRLRNVAFHLPRKSILFKFPPVRGNATYLAQKYSKLYV